MSITIEIEPILEAALKQRAEAAGLTLAQFALQLLEGGADTTTKHHPRVAASLQIIETLRGKLGPVPANALAPEFLYGDH